MAKQKEKKLSGKSWITWANSHAKFSKKVDDLVDPFKSNVQAFLKALEDAGATITVSTTKRSKKRAYLFHWSWKIHLGKCKPSDAKAMASSALQLGSKPACSRRTSRLR